jgi:hypothetical protein
MTYIMARSVQPVAKGWFRGKGEESKALGIRGIDWYTGIFRAP